jgi:DNA-binding NarL/FixJ family response regulator
MRDDGFTFLEGRHTMAESDTAFDGPKRLLVADDEHLVAMGMKNNLEELGYEVIGPAGDGQAAITLCETLKPDMALLDIQMPGLNGLAAAEKIYQELHIPVVIFSAYSDQEYVDSSNDAGVFGYILKPVTRDQLRVGIEVAWADTWIPRTKSRRSADSRNALSNERSSNRPSGFWSSASRSKNRKR